MHRFIRVVLAGSVLAVVACEEATQPATSPELSVDERRRSSDDELGPSPVRGPIPVAVRLVAEGLTSPITIVSADDRTGRLFIVDQAGRIWILTRQGRLVTTPFLDVTARMVPLRPGFDERGLLGLAFHPDYRKNGRFFVYYSAPLRAGAPAGYDHTARISEFRVSRRNSNVADPTSERIILEVDKPQFNHNGGTLAFGKDGFLYISIGDGGGANDVGLGHVEDWYADNGGGNGQDTEANLLGNILRIDIDRGAPYGIPRNNPFVGRRGLDEIYAYGLRNPYRFSFDMEDGRLFVGDAGQGLWEEVSIVERGGNYGWNVREGTHCFDAENNRVSPPNCPRAEQAPSPHAGTPLRNPVIEYANSANTDPQVAPPESRLGVTVIGGHVYRGKRIDRLEGRYVFGDFSRTFSPPNGSLLSASPERRGLWTIRELMVANRPNGRLGHYVLGFGQDDRGEVYVGVRDVLGPTGTTGKVYKLVPADDDDDDDDDDDTDDN